VTADGSCSTADEVDQFNKRMRQVDGEQKRNNASAVRRTKRLCRKTMGRPAGFPSF